MRKILLPIAAAIILFAIQSCTESGFGSSLIPTRTQVVSDSSFKISGRTVENNTLPARTLTQLLGTINADNYGTLTADFVSQMMPAWPIDTNYIDENGIDSCCFMLRLPIGGYTGDSVTPMRATVYRLTKPLPRPIDSSFDPTGYYDSASPLGSTSYTATALQSDSLADALDKTDYQYREIKVNVDRSVAVEIFRKFKEDPEIFRDPATFQEFFPGIYATTTFGNGRVVNIYDTEFKVYCRREFHDADLDTTIYVDRSYMASTEEVLSNNNVRLDISESVRQMVADGDAIIQTPAAYDVELNLPVQEILDRFKNDTDAQTVFNSVSLEIPAVELVNSRSIAPPEYLLLIPADRKNKFLSETNVPDNVTSFYAQYDATNGCYTFSEMRQYFLKLLDEKGGIAEPEDCLFSLTPIDVLFDESSSSTGYNYTNYYYYLYYGYFPSSSSSASSPIEVLPAMERPSIVKLDLENANLRLYYSRLFENN